MCGFLLLGIREDEVEGLDSKPHEILKEEKSDEGEGEEGAEEGGFEVADLEEVDSVDPAFPLELTFVLEEILG